MFSAIVVGPSGQRRVSIYNPGCADQSLVGVSVRARGGTLLDLGSAVGSIASGTVKVLCDVVSLVAPDDYPCDAALGYDFTWVGSAGNAIHLIAGGAIVDSVVPASAADATGQNPSGSYAIRRLTCTDWSSDVNGCAALVARGGSDTWAKLAAKKDNLKCRPASTRSCAASQPELC